MNTFRHSAGFGKQIIIFFIIALFLTSCSIINYKTPYAPYGGNWYWGNVGGYVDFKEDKDTFRVHFHSSAPKDHQMAHDYGLLRGAELCLENNYPYLSVSDYKYDVAYVSDYEYKYPTHTSTSRIPSIKKLNTKSIYTVSARIIVDCSNSPSTYKYVALTLMDSLKNMYKID